MSERLRAALVGLGRMGAVHARALQRLGDEIELVAVVEPRAETVEQLLEVTGAVPAFAELSAALAQAEPQAVIIATPTDTHDPVVESALESDRHVLCEKPLTLEEGESVRLGGLADSRQLVLQVGFWRRYCPPLVEAKRLLDAGAIGDPVLVRCVQWDVDGPPAAWCDPQRSGGIFVDMGVHEFDQLEWLLGAELRELEAKPLRLARSELAEVGDYDNALVFAEFQGGAHGLIDLSRNARYADDVRMEILGTDGAIIAETWPRPCVHLGQRDRGLEEVWSGAADDVFTASIAAELSAFAAAIQGGSAGPGASESIRATRLGVAARESAELHGVGVAQSRVPR